MLDRRLDDQRHAALRVRCLLGHLLHHLEGEDAGFQSPQIDEVLEKTVDEALRRIDLVGTAHVDASADWPGSSPEPGGGENRAL